MKKVEVRFTRSPGDSMSVGVLAENAGRVYFEYAADFLANDLDLSPFRRMAFNVLAHNRDDHVKNFAFLLDDTTGDWTLTPAYDLLFTPGPGGEHTMTVAGEGRTPEKSHMLRLAEQTDMSHREANAIIHEVQSAISHWPTHAAEAGLTATAGRQIADGLPTIA